MIRTMCMRREKSLLLHCSNCGGKRPVTLTPEKLYGSCDECHLLIEYSAPRRWSVTRRKLLQHAYPITQILLAALGLRKSIPVPAPVPALTSYKLKLSDTLALSDHFEVKEIS